MRNTPRLSRDKETKIREGDIDSPAFSTHCFTINGKIVVSTCYRKSSAMLAPDSWYYETFIFDEKGEWIGDETGNNHFDVVTRILENDGYKPLEEE